MGSHYAEHYYVGRPGGAAPVTACYKIGVWAVRSH